MEILKALWSQEMQLREVLEKQLWEVRELLVRTMMGQAPALHPEARRQLFDHHPLRALR
jgi:hypothetical protein